MSWTIKHLTEEEQKAFIPEFDLNPAKEWAIMDGDGFLEFFDTKKDAYTMLAELELHKKLGNLYDEWVSIIAGEFGVSIAELKEIIEERDGKGVSNDHRESHRSSLSRGK